MNNTPDKDTPEFSLVLASIVHDLKNGLSLLSNQFERYLVNNPPVNEECSNDAKLMTFELTRLNAGLVQLLGLYKLDQKQLSLHRSMIQLIEMFEDLEASHELLLERRNVKLTIEVDEMLSWYMDGNLIASVLNNIVTNAIRYTETQLHITVEVKDSLIITIADDGTGFPDAMLGSESPVLDNDLKTGSTQLGLYFARAIISMHGGSISLSNGTPLKGGCVQIELLNSH